MTFGMLVIVVPEETPCKHGRMSVASAMSGSMAITWLKVVVVMAMVMKVVIVACVCRLLFPTCSLLSSQGAMAPLDGGAHMCGRDR